jgi:hypothetical protein
MIAASHITIWPMKVATLGLSLILAGGLIHGLYSISRKVKTTV